MFHVLCTQHRIKDDRMEKYGSVEDRLTLVLDNSITCELYVMSNVMYHLTAKYTVYLWVSLRSFFLPFISLKK